jgi:hypothetical protein
MDEYNVIPAKEIYLEEPVDRLSDDELVERVDNQAEYYSEVIGSEELDYISAWHFTSHRLSDSILENGLMTRENTGMPGQDSQNSSHEDKVYFTAENGYTSAGKGIADKIGGYPMAVQALLNPDNLEIDEDTELMHDFSESDLVEENYYLASLADFGTVAHMGNIYPDRESATNGESFITDYEIREKNVNLPPKSVRVKFRDRALAAKRGQSSEDPEEIREEFELICENFESQISMSEARKLLEKQIS